MSRLCLQRGRSLGSRCVEGHSCVGSEHGARVRSCIMTCLLCGSAVSSPTWGHKSWLRVLQRSTLNDRDNDSCPKTCSLNFESYFSATFCRKDKRTPERRLIPPCVLKSWAATAALQPVVFHSWLPEVSASSQLRPKGSTSENEVQRSFQS